MSDLRPPTSDLRRPSSACHAIALGRKRVFCSRSSLRAVGFTEPEAAFPSTDNRSLITPKVIGAVRWQANNWVRNREPAAFTLTELLVVVGIIALLLVLVAPAFTSIKSGGDVTTTTYGISGALAQARTYAMANNTFVWVGFKEVDASKDASVNPQAAGTGRVAVAVVASKDGTRGYDVTSSSISNPAWTNYSNGGNLVAVGKLQHFESVHLANSLPATGNMTRPTADYVIGNAAVVSVTPFDWPLGSGLNAGQYSFQKVINFDPQGAARIQYSTNTDGIAAYIEVALQQAHGTSVPASANVAAVQIDCMTGSVRKYRP